MSLIQPCDNCKKQRTCTVHDFLVRNRNRMTPWGLADAIRGIKTEPAELVTADIKREYYLLECTDLQPVKELTDYSRLRGRYKDDEIDECQTRTKCSGDCKKGCS